jgi:hypothetical protein
VTPNRNVSTTAFTLLAFLVITTIRLKLNATTKHDTMPSIILSPLNPVKLSIPIIKTPEKQPIMQKTSKYLALSPIIKKLKIIVRKGIVLNMEVVRSRDRFDKAL